MPFIRTKLDYAVTFMFLIVFVFAFFFMSSFGDLHYSSNTDSSHEGNVNMQVFLGPLILVYEMFQIYVLPGKKRIRDIDKRLLLIRFNMAVRNKLQEGIDELYQWKNKR